MDLHNLDAFIGIPVSFRSLRLNAWASRLRLGVTVFSDASPPAFMLHGAMESRDYVYRLSAWHEWYQSAFVFVLERARLEALHLGLDAHSVQLHV